MGRNVLTVRFSCDVTVFDTTDTYKNSGENYTFTEGGTLRTNPL